VSTSLPAHLQALLTPEFYPHPADAIRLIQTHISWVFLAGCYAYKVKKPVNFGFLDFTTLAARKHYCTRELTLNRRLTDDIYLAVLPVCRSTTGYQLDSGGAIVDYCLQMHRFEQADLLENRLLAGQFNPAWMDELARDIALFHHRQPAITASDIDHYKLLAGHIRSNLETAAAHQPAAIEPATLDQLTAFADHALTRLETDLLTRQKQGFVRHCHGDLHLRNLTLMHGHPRPFDCIEFNDDFASIDCMNDIAFLVMDCDAHNRPDLGMRFLSRYLEHTADYAGLLLLNLYLFYRAGVRGKVACLLADEMEQSVEQTASLQEARHYLELAGHYAQPDKPRLFAVGGLSGSGKSHLALQGCGIERAVIIRTDATRKRIAPDHPQLDLYGMEMNSLTYQAMLGGAETALQAGWSVILDAAFLRDDERLQVRELADRCHVPLSFFWLDIATDLLSSRIIDRQQAGTDISDADINVLAFQQSVYQPPAEAWVKHLNSSDCWPARQQ